MFNGTKALRRNGTMANENERRGEWGKGRLEELDWK
jgi:hypothetical protein